MPWGVDIRKPPAIAAEKGTTWLSLGDISGAALPSPVKKLLQRLADGKISGTPMNADVTPIKANVS